MTTQIRLSRSSRFSAFKAIILCLLAGAACISFVGCGSDTESSTSPIGEITSSSSDEVIESSDGCAFLLTSSSEQGSSSSITPNESSSSVQSSSSEVAAVSSSSDVVAESSSSDKAESSSSEKSSSSVEESSSSVESSSSEVPSSSSVVESSSSVVESSSSDGIDDSSSSESIVSSSSVMESSSSEESSSSQQNVVLDSSYYDAEENALKDFRDGRIYKTITIGTQIWMAENLKLQKFGTKNIKSFCYDNNSENCELVGGLYIRSSALDSAALFSKNSKGCGNIGKACSIVKPVRGICPQNWHIPDSLEWTNLVDAVEGDKLNLRATNGWRETCYENPTNGKYGFDALPGYKDDTNFINNAANFWVGESTTRAMIISCWEQSTYIIYAARPEFAYSIRCIKDN